MKGDLHPIAFRLSQSLPVRKHFAPDPEPPRKVAKPGVGRGMNQPQNKRIRFRGVEYESVNKARRLLKVGSATLQRWIHEGSAEYV